MDSHNVYQLFSATFDSDRNVQKQAEIQLKQVEASAGFIPILLQILASQDSNIETKQAVAIYLKNRIRSSWVTDITTGVNHNHVSINPQDRDEFKKNILHILLTAPNAVRIQLLDPLSRVLDNDYPDKWPNYLSQVDALLTSNDPRTAYIGLLALQQVVKVYQWKSTEQRAPLAEIIQRTFAIILQMGQGLLNEINVDAAEMLRIINKIYSSAIQYDLSEALQDNNSIVPWVTFFQHLIEKDIPEEIIPNIIEDRQRFIWFRSQRWACQNLNRLFQRYGNPAQLVASSTVYTTFAEHFIRHFGPQILHSYLRKTEKWIKKEIWLSDKILFYFSEFYRDAITHKITWQIIKPYSMTLVSEYIFPQLCFSDEDEQLWTEDPVDYIHKKMDPLEDFNSHTAAAVSFLMDLAKLRKKYTFMGIMEFINTILTTYQNAPIDAKNPRHKDGALKMIGCLSDMVMRKKSGVAHLMEGFLITHVFSEFQSPYPFLRARACDMIIKFDRLDFEQESNLATAFQGITNCMRDEELPVKVQACLALQSMIRHETVRVALIPNIPMVMQQLLDLTNQIDTDTLANVMEDFVEVFSKELSPFAIQLCEQLRNAFLRIMQDYQNAPAVSGSEDIYDPSYDNCDKTMAAAGVLKTITTLILSLESTPEILAQLENALLPIITYTLENTITDLYDDIFDIIDSCTYSTKQISPTMWGIFDLIYKTFKGDDKISGIDYIEEMLPSLDNYISYGTGVFVQNADLQARIYDVIETVMNSDRINESERTCACKLIESVLLNCRGYVDQYVGPFLVLGCRYLTDLPSITTLPFKIYCIEIVINCLYYNPILTLRNLEERGFTQAFFSIWFEHIDKFKRVHDKKLVIVALCSLLEIPFEQLPPTLQAGWTQVLDGILTVFKSLPIAEENRENLEKSFDEEDSDDEDELESLEKAYGEDDSVDNDDENVVDEDTQYLEFLAQEAAKNNPDDDENEHEEEMEEEVMFESPLDKVDVYIKFHESFIGVQQHYPTSYNHLTKNLDNDKNKQGFIMSLFSIAEQRKNEIQSAQQS
ncbi:ARM repeat-containing protein [Gigaspora margarita]|uniref:ARM repeat-containing protein n=1 Tax=Gigaspora margarita TaxID=4874 RepID=A0A8H3XFE2_GIGMA|nr:ARM repeat-containing protein [Gigaspora margarita]